MSAVLKQDTDLLMIRNTRMMKKVKPRKGKPIIPEAKGISPESRFWGEGPVLRKANLHPGDPIKVESFPQWGVIVIERCQETESTHIVSRRLRKGMEVAEPVIDITNETVQVIPAGTKIDILVYRDKLVIRKEISFELIEYVRPSFTSDSLKKLRLLSIFSGGGTGTASMVDTGLYESVGAIEWGEMPIRTFAWNFPTSYLYWGDIANVSSDIPECDVVLLTPPCQRSSKLGIGQAGLDHAQSIHIARLILRSKCQAILIENVGEFYKTRGFEMLYQLLSPVFGHWVPIEMNPINMGGIASRPRGYRVAFRERVPFQIPLTPKVRKQPKVSDYLDEKTTMPWREKAGSTMAYFEGVHAQKYAHTGFIKSALTLVTPDSNRVACFAKEYFRISRTCSYLQHEKDSQLWRPFSITEVANMMNLPNWFEIPSELPMSLGYKILGEGMDGLPTKAIAVEVAAVLVGKQIKQMYTVKQNFEYEVPLSEKNGQLELIL
ncbi:DNA cytosine methyltransferase [Brevibacillus sp. AG]|uniref:DNA cytosine methyltransferase n=1 Tax=Brevibacillus sp. AG TaxID=3020891 RepID=UPI00232EAF39|nr:DNA cytosine methyltransferase [Brevibacillus sp. AG]MDC0764265.1 DNA cytosine methyltransferase [Brevibacillus sp. AG]